MLRVRRSSRRSGSSRRSIDGASTSAIARLNDYRAQLDEAIAGRPEGPVHRELADSAFRYGVPARVLHELLDGVARDCAPVRYANWDELSR